MNLNQIKSWKQSTELKILESQALNAYLIGSRVYGTSLPTSDYDFLFILMGGKEDIKYIDGYNILTKSIDSYKDSIKEHSMLSLECCFSPNEFKLKETTKVEFALNKTKLLEATTKNSIKSFVRAKKEFESGNVYVGQKRIFHSLRVLNFAKQIVTNNKITDYSSANHLWEEIYTNPNQFFDSYTEWHTLHYNVLCKELEKLCK